MSPGTRHPPCSARAGLAVIAFLAVTVSGCSLRPAKGPPLPLHTFHLEGGFFYGPGPIVPDTELPYGRLANIRFDVRNLRGFCEFANNGRREGLLSDRRTRINQNIDAGRLLIGGGTSPVMLTAVDGGPHKGTEQYYLDEQYRFVWRVDIALDPGFEEGIIWLDDFELATGVVRIGRSLQSRDGVPGGYDQAGSLQAGEFLAGRVGDFDQDGYLDGILVAAPNVPLAADMLPGAPVGNRRGFRTDVPIPAHLSSELMLRGALHLKEPILASLSERNPIATRILIIDLQERLRTVRARATHAATDGPWSTPSIAPATATLLEGLTAMDARNSGLLQLIEQGQLDEQMTAVRGLYDELQATITSIAELNARSESSLPAPSTLAAHLSTAEPRRKNY